MAPALIRPGLRTIVPTLRRFGDTRFLTAAAPRTGNSGILAGLTALPARTGEGCRA